MLRIAFWLLVCPALLITACAHSRPAPLARDAGGIELEVRLGDVSPDSCTVEWTLTNHGPAVWVPTMWAYGTPRRPLPVPMLAPPATLVLVSGCMEEANPPEGEPGAAYRKLLEGQTMRGSVVLNIPFVPDDDVIDEVFTRQARELTPGTLVAAQDEKPIRAERLTRLFMVVELYAIDPRATSVPFDVSAMTEAEVERARRFHLADQLLRGEKTTWHRVLDATRRLLISEPIPIDIPLREPQTLWYYDELTADKAETP